MPGRESGWRGGEHAGRYLSASSESPFISLAAFFAVSLIGGLLPLFVRLSHRGMQIALQLRIPVSWWRSPSSICCRTLWPWELGRRPFPRSGSRGGGHAFRLSGHVPARAVHLLSITVRLRMRRRTVSHASSGAGALVGLSIHGVLAGLAFGAVVSGGGGRTRCGRDRPAAGDRPAQAVRFPHAGHPARCRTVDRVPCETG